MGCIFAEGECSISVGYIFAVGGCLVKPSLLGFRALISMCKLDPNPNPNPVLSQSTITRDRSLDWAPKHSPDPDPSVPAGVTSCELKTEIQVKVKQIL